MGLFSAIGNLVGGKSKVNAPPTPDYYVDPNFSGTQDFLKKYAEDMLKGNMPDYYKAIGETADKGLMGDYISDSTRDIVNQDLEAGALTGRGRTGLSSNALNTIGNISGTLRYEDYKRAMQGREGLLKTGLGTEEGVRSSAYSNMGEKNTFDQWKYSADLAREQARAAQANAAKAQRWGAADELFGYATAPMTGGMSLLATNPSMSETVDLYNKNKPSAYAYGSSGVSSPDYGALVKKDYSGGNPDMMALVKKFLPMFMGA